MAMRSAAVSNSRWPVTPCGRGRRPARSAGSATRPDPGAGGTQRLPRLVGGELAVRMCTDGSRPAGAAAQAGLVDAVAATGSLLEAAIAFAQARAAAGRTRRTRRRGIVGRQDDSARLGVRRPLTRESPSTIGPAPLPREWPPRRSPPPLTLPFDQGSALERELFAECVLRWESRALRHLFFAEREAAQAAEPVAQARRCRR